MGSAGRKADKVAARAARKAARRGRRWGFALGASAGAGLALLLAPRSGKETRARLFGEGGLGRQVDRLKGAVGAGKDSAAEQSEALKRKIEETRERLRQQMDLAGDDSPGAQDASAPPAD